MVDANLTGKRIRLRPLEPSDYAGLRRQELGEHLSFRWRHHGAHDQPEAFADALWAGALVHFIVEDLRGGVPLGIVSAYGADFATGTVYVAAAKFSGGVETGSRFVGAIGLVGDYLFNGWPFRKVYFETAEYNLAQFDGAMGWLFVEEARFREHIFLGGRYWDQIVLALWRDTWTEQRTRLVRFA
jgi:hypothetical protein